MKTIEKHLDDCRRGEWGRGPWDDEPDHIQWLTEAGLPGLAVRHAEYGHWCGYVGVPETHVLHGKDYNEVSGASPHGGLTYSAACQGDVCHVREAGDPEVWWFGFDCCHLNDFSPGLNRDRFNSLFNTFALRMSGEEETGGRYKNLPYVKAEVELLAAQLLTATWAPREKEYDEP